MAESTNIAVAPDFQLLDVGPGVRDVAIRDVAPRSHPAEHSDSARVTDTFILTTAATAVVRETPAPQVPRKARGTSPENRRTVVPATPSREIVNTLPLVLAKEPAAGDEEPPKFRRRVACWISRRRRHAGTLFVSGVMHSVLALILALIIFTTPDRNTPVLDTILVAQTERVREPAPVVEHVPLVVPATKPNDALVKTEVPKTRIPPVVPTLRLPEVDESPSPRGESKKRTRSLRGVSDEEFQLILDSQFSGRSPANRPGLVAKNGGTPESEKAVELGLKWLARHQQADGRWDFDHRKTSCDAGCSHPGSANGGSTGATGMALLCFFGAGYTHQEGKYEHVVSEGLEYLLSQRKPARVGGDFRGKAHNLSFSMYLQGFAALAMCEAYGMTKDPRLEQPARKAIEFVVESQDRRGGGWRYYPGDAGDTSVVGWMVMALTSGRIAGLGTQRVARIRAIRFLDSVEMRGGAKYRYMPYTGPHGATTAIGVLSRMYLNSSGRRSLIRAVAYLSKLGPSRKNMYHNYYATQVMHHWGGDHWKKWNDVMRDHLVNRQEKEGDAAGSFFPSDPYGKSGGRLYETCLSVMTLEVYYRHLPLYTEEAPHDGRAVDGG